MVPITNKPGNATDLVRVVVFLNLVLRIFSLAIQLLVKTTIKIKREKIAGISCYFFRNIVK